MDSGPLGAERSWLVSSSVLHGIESRLKDFHHLLLSPPKVRGFGLCCRSPASPVGNIACGVAGVGEVYVCTWVVLGQLGGGIRNGCGVPEAAVLCCV